MAKTLIFISILMVVGCKSRPIGERGISNDRELMTRHIDCGHDYKLVIVDSIEYSKDSPYIFYYPDKFRDCSLSSFYISKLTADTLKHKNYTWIYFGEHRDQKIYSDINEDTLSFDFAGYNFNVMKDTVLVEWIRRK